MNSNSIYVGIDIGGTNTRIGLFDESLHLLDETTFDTLQNYTKLKNKIFSTISDLIGETNIKGMVISLAGRMDEKNEKLLGSPNLKDMVSKPIKDEFNKKFNTDIRLINDASASAVAEANLGSARDVSNFLYVNWGTGTGGKFVEKAESKIKLNNMEPGHQIIEWNGPKCKCGQNGCVEVFCGGYYLKKKYGDLQNVQDDEVWDTAAQYMAHALINTLHHYPTNLVVFGGGLVFKQKHLIDRISMYLEKNTKDFYIPELRFSKLGEQSGLYGAVRLFKVELI